MDAEKFVINYRRQGHRLENLQEGVVYTLRILAGAL